MWLTEMLLVLFEPLSPIKQPEDSAVWEFVLGIQCTAKTSLYRENQPILIFFVYSMLKKVTPKSYKLAQLT